MSSLPSNARFESAPDGWPLAWLALATGALPLAVVHLCYLLSVQANHVPACVPYIEGCTSISAAGRHGAAYFLFKAGMIPAAVLAAAYWALCRRWLLALGGRDSATARAMVALGVVSATFLVLYVVYLGSKGDFYNLMRRFGVNVHLSFAVLAQMILARELTRLPGAARSRLPAWLSGAKLALVTLLLALGLASIPVGNFMVDKSRVQNAIEWTFAALMAGYYLLTALAWRRTDFRARFSAAGAPR